MSSYVSTTLQILRHQGRHLHPLLSFIGTILGRPPLVVFVLGPTAPAPLVSVVPKLRLKVSTCRTEFNARNICAGKLVDALLGMLDAFGLERSVSNEVDVFVMDEFAVDEIVVDEIVVDEFVVERKLEPLLELPAVHGLSSQGLTGGCERREDDELVVASGDCGDGDIVHIGALVNTEGKDSGNQ